MQFRTERRALHLLSLATLCSDLVVRSAQAQTPSQIAVSEASAGASVDASVVAPALVEALPEHGSSTPVNAAAVTPSEMSDSGFDGYLRRYPRRSNRWEVGAFAGTVIISDDNAFRGAVARTSAGPIVGPFSQFNQPSLELGARAAYFPFSFLGAELEGFFAPASTERGGSASVLGGRGHVILQAPFWSITPFLLGGAGVWRVTNGVSGNDGDPAFHIGTGAKAALTDAWSVRLDLRDSITSARDGGSFPHHFEALAGAHFEFGGKGTEVESEPPLAPEVLAPAPPVIEPVAPLPALVPTDTDGDGIDDAHDQCLDAAGVAPTGCPDTDGDQVLDRDDACPDVPGIAPRGCPEQAPPPPIETFAGVIDGIEFDSAQDVIRLTSRAALDNAVGVLVQHPALRVEVIGHTDDQGDHAFNVTLSQRRAEAVKRYLVEHGVEESRVLAHGVGPDEPLSPNDSAAARQKNRRIEFRIAK